MAKIVSAIALFAIFLGIVGTGVLFVVSSLSNSSQNQELSKEDLQKLVKDKVQKEWVSSSKECLYKLYRRKGRKDTVTMVHNMDLVEISYKIINK